MSWHFSVRLAIYSFIFILVLDDTYQLLVDNIGAIIEPGQLCKKQQMRYICIWQDL